ncbi:MAG: hypothetical protein GW763_07705 [Paraglaciecola sp.]|nr:hypothetical protein [Paraglaciecola sp.]NCT47863.1 hypothetical protein [Paraglaciecola sp.]
MQQFVIFCCVILSLHIGLGANAQQIPRPKSMTFSYVNHPVILEQLIPVIREAYASIGISTQFVEQPSDRNLRAIEKGLVDGDVVFSKLLLANHPGLLVIEPALVTSIFILVCQPQIPCEKSVISDNQTLIASTNASHNGLESWYQDELQAQFYYINNLAIIPQLIKEKRFDYGIYILTPELIEKAGAVDFRYYELFRTSSYHILHPKYAFLKTEIEQAIRGVLTNASSTIDAANPVHANRTN